MITCQLCIFYEGGKESSKRWEGLPKFNNPTARNELEQFAKEIVPECSLPDVGFDVHGIEEQVRDFFNEQRRHQKRVTIFISFKTKIALKVLDIHFRTHANKYVIFSTMYSLSKLSLTHYWH